MTTIIRRLNLLLLLLVSVMISLTTVNALSNPVAVLGGTGRLGQQTVRQLINQNIPVKCLVRPDSKNLPKEWENESLVEIVRGELLLLNGTGKPTYGITNAKPSSELIECLNGCHQCIAVYGATRRTKISDFFLFLLNKEIEDIDPIHAKQINYRSIQGLLTACTASGGECTHIIRITGKGEDPTGKISILINLLGSFAKAWNYEGEELLRGQTNIGYTIIRPGIMKEKIDEKKKIKDDDPVEPRYLELMDDGGNELKVSAVEYNEIGELITELIVLENNENKLNNRRVTLAAMNVEGIPKEDGRKTLKERVLALRNDRRDFPKSLIDQHKSAVYGFAKKLALFGTITIVSLIWFIINKAF